MQGKNKEGINLWLYFFAYVFVLSLLFLVIGIIVPKIVIRWGENRNRKKVFKFYGTTCLISLVLAIYFSPPSEQQTLNTTQTLINQQENDVIKKRNIREFDEFYQDFNGTQSGWRKYRKNQK